MNVSQQKTVSWRMTLVIATIIALLILGASIDVIAARISPQDHLRWTALFFSTLVISVSAELLLLWRGFAADYSHAQERTIAALRESEARFHQMFEAHGAIMLLIDPQSGMIFDANQAAVRFYGYSKAALCALNINQINMLSPEQVAEEYTRALYEERNYFVFPHRLADGTVRTIEVYSSPIAVQSKRVLFSIIHDITERRQAEEALRQSGEEHRRTLEARVATRTAEVQDLYEKAPIGYHSLDADGTLTMVNQTELQWLGYAREEMIGQPVAQFLAADSLEPFRDSFANFKQRGWVRDVELNMRHRDGTIVPMLISATAVYDEQGTYVMSRSAVFNNTLRKQAEDALRQSEEQNHLLFAESPEPVVLFNEQGQMAQVNRAFALLTGHGADALVGRSLEELRLVPPDQTSMLSPRVREQLQRNAGFAITEFRLSDADGNTHDIEARTLRLGFHGRQHYLIAMRDITAAKHAAETLRQANAELARAARTKDEFLATMSHELRTPLNAILGMSESLLEEVRGPLNQRQQDSLRTIEASGHHLLTLINDILDLSKVEAGRLDLQKEVISVAELCQASMLFVKEQGLRKALKLALHLDDQLLEVEADARRLKQMLVNLLSNAVKFTPDRGQVRLDVTASADDGVITFVVADTGIGIAPEDIPRLFQPFRQLDSSLSRQHEGSGLGLALVRKLAELHGGSVSVESELGTGSRFTIALPYAPPVREAAPDGLAARAATPRSALVVEDAESAAEQLTRYLHESGVRVSLHPQGEGALEQAIEQQPSVIFLDLLLPDQTGWSVLAKLKTHPLTHTIPVVIASVVDERTRGLAAGAAAYLVKPISREALRAALEMIAAPAGQRCPSLPVAPPPQPAPTEMRVLLAEDNETNIFMLRNYLEDKGGHVSIAHNGREAIERASAARFDVILMDIQMPEMDGLEAIRRLRAIPAYAATPIIALTALAMPGDRERCLRAGASAYLMKPVSLRALIETIRRLLIR